MDPKRNLILMALRTMMIESQTAGDRAHERCLNGCIKSLKATSNVVRKIEDLEGLQGFTKAMMQRIKNRFENGPLRCDCNKKCKNLEDLESHIGSSHQKKKPTKNAKRSSKQEVDISGVKLPEKGSAALAVLMALNGENISLTKRELQKKAQQFTQENLTMTGNQLDVFKSTWHRIESLVMSGLIQKVGTPVKYSISAKGLKALVENRAKEADMNLYKKIPQKHRSYFGENQMIRKIIGDGSCLYGCASYFLNEVEDRETMKDLRRRAHKFLKDTWADLDEDQVHALLFPQEFIVAGEVSKRTFDSVSDWLRFLQTEQSLFVYTEFEVETQSLANFLNTTIKIFHFNSSVEYMNTYTPTPHIATRSPFSSSNKTMEVYHEIDSHFQLVL